MPTAIAAEIRKHPETNGSSEGFSLLYKPDSFFLLAQGSKFAELSYATHSGMSVAKSSFAQLNSGADEKEGGEPWYQVLFYGF